MSRATPLTLAELLAGFAEVSAELANQPVVGLALDSRAVRRGDVFFALRGGNRHGLEFLAEVQAAGAMAVVWEPPYPEAFPAAGSGLPLLEAPGLRRTLGQIASRFHNDPSRRMAVVGITGTDGKTSCAHFIAQALNDAKVGPCGLLGTLGLGVYGAVESTLHTTPDALAVQRWLAKLAAGGRRYAVMEASSHALDQGRVEGIEFAVAVLTHLSRDHLDYHGSLDAYATAKRRLFLDHRPHCAVLNLDDAFGRSLAVDLRGHTPTVGYSLGEPHHQTDRLVRGEKLELLPGGLRLTIRSSWGDGELQAGLLGRFNASNLLAALATLLALEVPFDEAMTRLTHTVPVSGRMERVSGTPDQPLAVIDYAHTPHALEQVLSALREHGGNRLWCVFGCGGDRDAGKRPLMGAVAERWADRIIVTNDNPRTEDPDQIVSAILAGMRQPHAAAVIRNREAAIAEALAEAAAGDLVLIAGKGHEDYQIIGTERRPFSDRAVVQQCLSLQRLKESIG